MSQFFLQIQANSLFSGGNAPDLEVMIGGAVVSTISMNSGSDEYGFLLDFTGGFPSSLSFRFASGSGDSGDSITFSSLQINGQSLDLGSYLANIVLNQGQTSNVNNLPTIEYLFGQVEPTDASLGTPTITGTAGDDPFIEGTAGDDVIDAQGGNDLVVGFAGDDKILGGAGNDQIFALDGDDIVLGGTGDDLIIGGIGNDELYGQIGNDTVVGEDGDDVLNGGAGDDGVFGDSGADTLFGGTGNDTLGGGLGNDVLHGEAGNDILIGNEGDDGLFGGDGDDQLFGDTGNDTIDGGDGDDYIVAGTGNDVVDGGLFNDEIFGEDGQDTINGGSGNDYLSGGGDNDILNGDDGNDFIIAGTGADVVDGGNGRDIIHGNGLDAQTVSQILFDNPNVIYSQETGSFYQFVDNSVSWNAARTAANSATLNGVSGHLVTITSAAENNIVYQLGVDNGADNSTGVGGNRIWLAGTDEVADQQWVWSDGAESDIQFSQAANARNNFYENWGSGQPNNSGGAQTRATMWFNGGADDSTWDDRNDSDTHDYVIEWDGGSFSDDNAVDTLSGGAGNDWIYGYGGNDILDGGENNDTVLGGLGDDTIIGGEGNDALIGQDGNDTIIGGNGIAVPTTTLLSYGGSQDGVGTATQFDGGVTLDGNIWRKVQVDYTITADTILEFDFRSTLAPEISGIGFDNDNVIESNATFQMFGTQSNFGRQNFDDYDGSGEWMHFRIDIGSFYTGTFSNLFFVNDDDGNSPANGTNGNSSFANITIYEATGVADTDTGRGGDGDDQLFGNEGNDVLYGAVGADILSGNDGNDTLNGDVGNDILHGGDGTDRLNGGDDFDELYGGAGNDTLRGDDGDDTLYGGADDDNLNGGDGADTLIGGDGNDSINGGNGNDLIIDTVGDDVYNGSNDIDTISYASATGGVTVNLGITSAQNTVNAGNDRIIAIENIIGSSFNDTIQTRSGVNILEGRDGDDVFIADSTHGYDDIFDGGDGNDIIRNFHMADPLNGSESLYFDTETNFISIEEIDAGNQQIRLGNATTIDFTNILLTNVVEIYGSSQADNITGSNNADTILGNGGDDVLNGGGGNDTLRGGGGIDILNGGDGDEIFQVNGSEGRDDTFNGDAGTDIVRNIGTSVMRFNSNTGFSSIEEIDGNGQRIEVDAATTIDFSGIVVSTNVTEIRGSSSGDSITGTQDDDIINGGNGNDIINGDLGDDTINGGNNDDIISGGLGNDMLRGGAGIDTLNGDDGDDIFQITGAEGRDDTYNGGAGTNIVRNIGTGTITINGNTTFNNINEIDGNNQRIQLDDATTIDLSNIVVSTNVTEIRGSNSADNVTGTQDDDVITGRDGNDVLNGGLGDDTLNGGNDDDVLNGGLGNDTLRTSAGMDTLNGEDGDDIFIVSGGEGRDDTFNGGAGTNLIRNLGTGSLTFNSGSTFNNINEIDANGARIQVDANSIIDFSNIITSTNVQHIRGSSAGGETITGTQDDDLIYGFNGDDILNGDLGNDTLEGGNDNDTLNGGLGNDTLRGGAGIDILNGEDGDDIFRTGGVEGLDDTYNGGIGNDIIRNTGTGTMRFNSGSTFNSIEEIDANGGRLQVDTDQTVDFSSITTATNVLHIRGTSTGGETITGTQDDDLIYGFNGDDILNGSFGNDTINGGNDNDTLSGGMGNDVLNGNNGIDTVDYSNAGAFVNVNLTSGTAADGDGGTDTLNTIENITGSDFGDDLIGDANANVISGGLGNDFITSGGGIDVFNGDDGIDTVDYSGASSAADINLATGIVSDDGNGSTDTISTVENIIGTDFDDTITGDGEMNVLDGGLGDDTINAGAGNDVLNGGGGADILNGGLGNDTINSNSSATLTAAISQILTDNVGVVYSAETNSFYQHITTNATWTTANTAANAATLTGLSDTGYLAVVTSESENDFIFSFAGGNRLWIGGSDASSEGTWSWTNTSGGPESGVEFWSGGAGGGATNGHYSNWVAGDPSNGSAAWDYTEFRADGTWWSNASTANFDYIIEWDADELLSTVDRVTLNGGEGTDTLYGDAGLDIFDFDTTDALDIVENFDALGHDAIDISDILSGYDSLTSDINDFVTLSESGGNTTLTIDANGAVGGASYIDTVQINGVTDLDLWQMIAADTLIA